MQNKDFKNLILIAFGLFLVFSYILGTLDPFEASKFTRFVQVCILGIIAYFYFEKK
jgi:hypothetical protein